MNKITASKCLPPDSRLLDDERLNDIDDIVANTDTSEPASYASLGLAIGELAIIAGYIIFRACCKTDRARRPISVLFRRGGANLDQVMI